MCLPHPVLRRQYEPDVFYCAWMWPLCLFCILCCSTFSMLWFRCCCYCLLLMQRYSCSWDAVFSAFYDAFVTFLSVLSFLTMLKWFKVLTYGFHRMVQWLFGFLWLKFISVQGLAEEWRQHEVPHVESRNFDQYAFKTRKLCETGPRLLWDTDRKSHMGIRLRRKLMTLDDLEIAIMPQFALYGVQVSRFWC